MTDQDYPIPYKTLYVTSAFDIQLLVLPPKAFDHLPEDQQLDAYMKLANLKKKRLNV